MAGRKPLCPNGSVKYELRMSPELRDSIKATLTPDEQRAALAQAVAKKLRQK